MTHATTGLMVVGGVFGWVAVSVGAELQSPAERELLGSWFTASGFVWRDLGVHGAAEVPLVAAVVGMVWVWLVVAWRLRAGGTGQALSVGLAAWTAPFVLGPPFLSRDAYAYLAQGDLLRRGFQPYHDPALSLGDQSPLLQAMDPVWRGTVPPYGPLALRLQELCAWLGGLLGPGGLVLGLVALRVLFGLALLGTVVLLRRAVPQERRALVTWVACSPLVLLQLLGALHLEAVLCLLLVAAALLVARGRLASAVLVTVAACEIKATAGVVLLALVVHGWRTGRLGRAVASGLLAAAAGVALLPADPFGWVRGLATPGRGWNPFTPSTSLSVLLSHAGITGTRTWCTWLVAGAGVALVVRVVLKATDPVRAGTSAALVLALCGPAVWPWYLAPVGLLLLLGPREGDGLALVLGALPALAALPLGMVHAQRVFAVAAVLCALVVLAVRCRRPRSPDEDLALLDVDPTEPARV